MGELSGVSGFRIGGALRILPECRLRVATWVRCTCSRERSDHLGWHAQRSSTVQVNVHPLSPGSHERLAGGNVGWREQAVGGDRQIVLDERLLGIGAAAVAIVLRLPLLAVVIVAAAVTAGVRALS